jgi:hypothetical protein
MTITAMMEKFRFLVLIGTVCVSMLLMHWIRSGSGCGFGKVMIVGGSSLSGGGGVSFNSHDSPSSLHTRPLPPYHRAFRVSLSFRQFRCGRRHLRNSNPHFPFAFEPRELPNNYSRLHVASGSLPTPIHVSMHRSRISSLQHNSQISYLSQPRQTQQPPLHLRRSRLPSATTY